MATTEIKLDPTTKKLSLISFSGDFDKLTAVFTLATGAAAVGYEVNLFFTFWGLECHQNETRQKPGRQRIPAQSVWRIYGRTKKCSREPVELCRY
ncbi:MAG: DsrE/DsrF/DrsH-like family protein [Paludibacter sp.]